MTEAEALAWLEARLSVSRETLERLDAFRRMVLAENEHQNLVSRSSIDSFWARHIVDSAQLLALRPATSSDGPWLDLGTGAGFPGMVIAILRGSPITMVESRRRRSDFLALSAQKLALSHATIVSARVETMPRLPFSIISARAFAPLDKLLSLAHSFSTPDTLWLLPKGRSAGEELATVKASWQGLFHVEPSVTDSQSAVIVASGIRKKGKA